MAEQNGQMSEDDSVDIRPWPVMELIGRAVVLASVARRGTLEVDSDRDVFDLETDRFDLVTWTRTELQNWVSDRELELLSRPVGELDDDDLAECDDALISASTIAWTLRAVPSPALPMPQDGVAEGQVLEWAPEPWAKVRALQSAARLRADDELARERERWELWYWRATDVADDMDALADVVAELEESDLIPIVDGDFATDAGIPFSALGQDDQDDVAWLSELRLRALNWACGFGDSWETAPLYLDD
jgi:hypothetical protein